MYSCGMINMHNILLLFLLCALHSSCDGSSEFQQCLSPNTILRCMYKCPPERTCQNQGILFNCLTNNTEKCENKCVCRSGYRRNSIGDCVSIAECDQCSGDHEFFSCGSECDNECGKIGIQNRTNCPIINITCNKRCYCEDGYSRDENNICVPNEKCPNVRCPGQNESLGCVYNDSKSTCKNSTPQSGDNIGSCKPQCVCNEGFYRNEMGECVSAEDFEFQQCLSPNTILRCMNKCPPERTCENRGIMFDCLLNNTETCENKCVCRSGYYKNAIGECVTGAECDQCSGEHEFFSCGNECDNDCGKIGIQNRTNCPIINETCTKKCYCKDGYSRDENGICVPNEKCPNVLCPREDERLGCVFNGLQATCENRTPKFEDECEDCKPQCVCNEGLYRNIMGECVSEDDCAKSCGPNEYYMECLQTCPSDECLSLFTKFKCPPPPQNCTSGCRCKDGFLRMSKDMPCMPVALCPEMIPLGPY